MGSVLLVPENFINSVEKLIFDFLWTSRNEPLKRNTLYLPKLMGGIGLVNIRWKLISLNLMLIGKLIVSHNCLPWTFFGHIWLGVELCKFKNYSFSNLFPHCIEDPPLFYSYLIKNVRNMLLLDKNFDFVCGRTAKCYYNYILNLCKEDVRVVSIFPHVNFVEVFRNLTNRVIDPCVLNVSYKLAHNVLPVAYVLDKYGMTVCKYCSFCKKECETVEHLFFYCPFVQTCKYLIDNIFSDVDAGKFCLDHVKFSAFSSSVFGKSKDTLLVCLSEYRYSIWFCRNLVRFDKKRLTQDDVYRFFLSRLRNRILVDFHRMPRFNFLVLWEGPSMCTVEDDEVVFHFS
jgi:hypothetical protein